MEEINSASTTQGVLETTTPYHMCATEDLTTTGLNNLITHTLTSKSEHTESMDERVVESLCRQTLIVPYTNPCYGTINQFARVSNIIICAVRMALNIISLLALNKMKLSKDTLFLLKMLSFYDSLTLFSAFWHQGLMYFAWVTGLGFINHTAYYFVHHISYCVYRTAFPVAFWLVCLLAANRCVARTFVCLPNKKLNVSTYCCPFPFRYMRLKFKNGADGLKTAKLTVTILNIVVVGLEVYYWLLYKASVFLVIFLNAVIECKTN